MVFIKTSGDIEMEMKERPVPEEEREKMRMAYEQMRPFLRSSSPSSFSSPPKQEEDPLCPLGNSHLDVRWWASSYLSSHRHDIGIEDPWSLLVEAICPSQSHETRTLEASIEWDSEVWFARVSLCCHLPFELRKWVLIHELYELKHWRTGDAFHNLASLLPPSELRDLVIHQFYQARNQEIEQEVGQYLNLRRPNHMTAPSPQPLNDEELVDHQRAWREEEPTILTLTEQEMENLHL